MKSCIFTNIIKKSNNSKKNCLKLLLNHQSCFYYSKSINIWKNNEKKINLSSQWNYLNRFLQNQSPILQQRLYSNYFGYSPYHGYNYNHESSIYIQNKTKLHSLQYIIKPSYLSVLTRTHIPRDFESVNLTNDCSSWSTDILSALNSLSHTVEDSEQIISELREISFLKESLNKPKEEEILFSDDEEEIAFDNRRQYLFKKYQHFITMKWFGLDDQQIENFEGILNGFTALYDSQSVASNKIFDLWIRIFRYFFDRQEDNQSFPLRLVNGGRFNLKIYENDSITGNYKHRLVSNDEKEFNYVSFSGPSTDETPRYKLPYIIATSLGAAIQNFQKISPDIMTQELYHIHFHRASAIIYHTVVHRDYLRNLEHKELACPKFDEISATEASVGKSYLLTRVYGPLKMNDAEDREIFIDILDRIYFNSPLMKTGVF